MYKVILESNEKMSDDVQTVGAAQKTARLLLFTGCSLIGLGKSWMMVCQESRVKENVKTWQTYY